MRLTSDHISIAVALLLAAGIVAGIAVNAGSGWDFANFYDAGHKVVAGQMQDLYDPDVSIAGKPSQARLPYWGTPLSAFLLAPLAWMPPATALVVFKIQNSAALLLGLWLLYGFNKDFSESPKQYRALFLTAALVFQPFWTIYRVGGQTTPTVFLAFVAAFICYSSGRFLTAAICLVAAIAIKPAFVLMLVFLALIAGLRFLAHVLVTGAVAAGISIALAGWDIHRRFLERLSTGWISPWFFNSSLSVLFDNLRGIALRNEYWYAPASFVVRATAAVLVIACLMESRRRTWPESARRHFQFSMAIAFGLFLMPIVWEHYLAMLFIPFSYMLVFIRRAGRPLQALLVLFGAACFLQNLVFVMWLRSHLPDTRAAWLLFSTALFKSAPLLLFAMVICWQRKRLFAMYEVKRWELR